MKLCPEVLQLSRALVFVGVIGVCCLIRQPTVGSPPKSYDGYSIYRVDPRTEHDLRNLQSLVGDKRSQLQFWKRPVAINRTVDILVGPKDRRELYERLKYWLLPANKTIPNVQALIEHQDEALGGRRWSKRSPRHHHHRRRGGSRRRTDGGFYERFQSYAGMEAKLNGLASQYPSQVTLEVIGQSTEGRKLYLVRVSKDGGRSKKPVIFIDAGHHAREWISHTTGLYLLESLVNDNMPKRNNAGHHSKINARLDWDTFDFWFVPVVNPDGYEYSRTGDRMWRKTRSRPRGRSPASCGPNGMGQQAVGVDPNRNYPLHWRGKGTSSSICEEIYAGERALSEPETAAVAKLLRNNRDRIVMYLTLHTYGQVILAPYGYDTVRADNFREHERLASRFVEAVAAVRGTQFKFGNAAELMGAGAGGSDDFAKGDAGIRFSFTIELPDTGNKGFMLPPSQIVPVGQETLIGLKAMLNELKGML